MSRMIALVSVLLLIAACGGADSGGSTTAPNAVTTSEAVEVTTVPSEDDPGVASLEDMPAECIDAFRNFLQAIEPIIQDIDFQNSTMNDLDALSEQLQPISDSFEAETANCPELDMSSEESIAAMQAMAERDAPGTAAYFAWLASLMASVGDGGGATVSGDCETDIAAMQEYIDRGGTMSDLTMGELTAVSTLMSALATECSAERFQEWAEQADVAAFSGG